MGAPQKIGACREVAIQRADLFRIELFDKIAGLRVHAEPNGRLAHLVGNLACQLHTEVAGPRDYFEMKIQELKILRLEIRAIVHGGAQQPFCADHVEQAAEKALFRRCGQKWGVDLADLGEIGALDRIDGVGITYSTGRPTTCFKSELPISTK